jgi:hypothetical protein
MAATEQSKLGPILLGAILACAAVVALLIAVLGIVGPYVLFLPDDIDPVDRPPKLWPIVLYVALALAFSYGAWRSFRVAMR